MWSKELQQQTREFFEIYPTAAMKHYSDDRYGVCIVRDEKYIIADRTSDEKWEYDSLEELIADGWAID